LSQSSLFSYLSVEDRAPHDHPLRAMRRLLDPVLGGLAPRFFLALKEQLHRARDWSLT
jgi:hypothetical protein